MATEIHSDAATLTGLNHHRGTSRDPQPQPQFAGSPRLSQSILPVPASTAPDLNLLSKVAGVFWQSDRYETESQMFLAGRSGGADIKMSAQIKTIAQTGGKFISQLSFAPPGTKGRVSYIITSNGQKVWIYRPDRRQYAETTLAQFKSGSNSLWIGGYSFFFTLLQETQRLDLLSSLGTQRDFIKSLPQSQLVNLKGSERQIDGMNLYTYSALMKDKGIQANFSVDPENGTVQRFEANGRSQGINFSLLERVVSRSSQVQITPTTFKFVPPKGVKKMKVVEIDPLNR
jgi:outer membrane lipoprotein-sorting protein